MSWALVVTLLPDGFAAAHDPANTAPAGRPSPHPVGPDGLVALSAGLVRPDWTSASVTARLVGQPVEVLSERSESRRVWLWPDGQVQVEQAGGPVQFRDPGATTTHGWSRIDTTLRAQADGSVAPVAPVALGARVRLGKGREALVAMRDEAAGGHQVSLSLPGVVLPEPVLEGPVARYPEVLPGVDATVEVRPSGFKLLWVVKTAAAAADLERRFGSGDGVVMPTVLESETSTASVAADGSITMVDTKGRKRGVLGAPQVWDSAGGRADPRGRGVRAGWRLGARGRSARAQSARAGVVVSKKWLGDPGDLLRSSGQPTTREAARTRARWTAALTTFGEYSGAGYWYGLARRRYNRIAVGASNNRYVGAKSYLFGDCHTPGGHAGRMQGNRTSRIYAGWSGARMYNPNGQGARARTVFRVGGRYRIRGVERRWYINILRGPRR